MTLAWDLEDWLTDEGDRIVNKTPDSRSDTEGLVYEVWLLDTEARNGGVSQYFANHERERWDALVELASSRVLHALGRFMTTVENVIAEAEDPYAAVINSAVDLDAVYDQEQTRIITELRELVDGSS